MAVHAFTNAARPIMSLTDVGRRYDSGFSLDGISFDLPSGYIMGLIGPNGAGKSTLIKLILNMLHRDSGSITLFGLDNILDEEQIKRRLGVVFDTCYLLGEWRVRRVEAIMAPMYSGWDAAVYARHLARFGIDGAQRVKDLSRGMQMKLMLAIALSHDARLLILDEPTSGLDVLGRDELMDILRDYIQDGEHSVLFSTHITQDLESAADFITYITGGTLYYTGPKDEFEDSFRVVKGGPHELDKVSNLALGVHRYATGFDALIGTERCHDLVERSPGLVVEPSSIDEIIRLTNTHDEATQTSVEVLGGAR